MPYKKGYQTSVPATIKKAQQVVEKWTDVKYIPESAIYYSHLNRDIEYLRKILVNWSIVSQSYVMDLKQRAILCDYIRCYHEYTEFDQFDSEFETLKDFHSNMERIKNIQLIYKSFNLFKNSKWQVRFDSKFVSKFAECNISQMKYILSMVLMLADGIFLPKSKVQDKFGYAKAITTTRAFTLNRFFAVKCFREKNFLVHIGVQKVPVLSKNNNVIKRYEFKSIIQFLDILGDSIVENTKKLDERLKIFVDKVSQDVARKDHSEQIVIDMNRYSKYTQYLFYEELNPYNDMKQIFQTAFSQNTTVYFPLPFEVYYVSSTQSTTLVFDKNIKRWISHDYLDRVQRKKLNEYQKKINQQLVKRFVDFQSAKTLVQLLTKIPNFKVKLTEQQKDVIGQNGNVMVIGRSGTGKTTCAVLRLFSIEMLFKIRLSLYKKKFSSQISNTRCSSNDIDQAIGLHCIFLTASPVLTNEIQRYYKKLTDNLKDQLQKKKKRVQEERKRKQIEQKAIREEQNQDQNSNVEILQQNKDSQSQISKQKSQMVEKESQFQKIDENSQIPESLQRGKSQEVIEEESEMNHQLKDIKLKQNVQNQDFNEDQEDFDKAKQQFQQKIKRYQSLEDLQEKDFPGFFTVKSYIMMIDGTLNKPFFIRSKNSNEILEQQSAKAAWHNERKGVMMIENYYKNQEANGNEQEINENLIDQIEQEINYSDEEELEHEYLRQIQLRANQQKQQLTKKLAAKKKKNVMSFEVDFDFFLTHFWPNVNRRFYSSRNITPQLVWTEIYSTIKGSASAHTYAGQYMPEKVYINESQNVFLTQNQKLDIYETFCQYERWKIRAGGYDLMDTVNYVLNYIRWRGYTGPQIHYVMIDEVQDLPHAIIYLLSKTALYGVFYSGDTAQTIAKGVGFRFCDLKSLFEQKMFATKMFDSPLELKKPIVKHLTVNFRSHNNILQLANSIVSSLQILFPKTIDKLAKQRSDLDGPKPMILAQNDQQMLFYVLCGEQKSQQKNQNNGMKKPPLQFGCDQVIIVRDQQSKQKIPNMLQHALCLTIYEAKGLEFNDVILFNFFSQCKYPQKWTLLKYLKVIDYQISKQQYDRNLTRHNEEQKLDSTQKKTQEQEQNEQIIVDSECIVQQKDQNIKIKKITSDIKKIMKDINDYAELCSDLKLLYTAITRPRNTLIIYDQDPTCRKLVQKMWENLGIIQIITKSLIEEQSLNSNSNTNIFKRVIQATDKNDWKKQGLKMYARGYFEQAMKCFEKSQNEELFKKAKANLLADKATKMLIGVQSQRNSLKQGFIGYNSLSSSQISKLKKKLKHNEIKSYSQFNQAAKIFESMQMFKQAGQCYFSGRKFEQAKETFLQSKMLKQAAQSCEMLEQYKQASQLYNQQGDYLKVIECLDMINEWEQILRIIKKYESQMSQVQKSSLLKKYSSLALQELVYEIEFENQDENDKQKKPENNRIQIIQQKQSDQQEDDYSDSNDSQSQKSSVKENKQNDPQEQAEQSYKLKNKSIIQDEVQIPKTQSGIENIGQQIKSNNIMLESVFQKIEAPEKSLEAQSFSDLNQTIEKEVIKQEKQKMQVLKQNNKALQSVEDESFSDLNDSKQPEQIVKIEQKLQVNGSKKVVKQVDSSFSDLNQSQDFSDLNTKYQRELDPDIESIRSLADPQDPWIKSAISVSDINPKSQYSIIDESQNYNINVKIIKTKGNIFIQDQIMQKIVRIVSIINSSSTTFLQQFKGYQSLITVNKTQHQQTQIQNTQIADFEDIDSETINVILDTLQSFKLYKLCLFVCNRYHLPEKAGRYLVSIMMKYSTNCQSNVLINSGLLAPSNQRKTELERGILGSIAVHSILENVNSQFLKIKISSNEDENKKKNTLGAYFIQGLILQGFYKKTVFITNPQESLHILDNFCDYELFRDVCKNKFLKFESSQNELFLQKIPKTQIQTKYSLISMRDVIGKYQVANRLDMISQRYYKQFGFYDKVNFFKDIKVPQYLPYMKNIMAHNEDLYVFLNNQLPLTYKILVSGNELQTADAVLGLLCIMHNNNLVSQLFDKCDLKAFLQYYRCIKHIRNVIYHLDGLNSLNILRPILTFYQCKLIENYKSMSFLGSGYCFLNRTSNMANQLIQSSKTQPEMFAFFFQQDFNFIMVKISTVIKIIKQKFNKRLSFFLAQRAGIQRFKTNLLPDQYLLHNQQLILIDALKQAVSNIVRKQTKNNKKAISKKVKTRDTKPGFDYKTHGKMQHAYIINQYDLSEDQQQQTKVKYTRQKYVLPIFEKEMAYLGDQMLSIFNKKVKQASDIAMGRQLYCVNLNSYYREYVQKIGGYNLYDAIQFKRFKRVDLYADNILSVIDTFPIIDKHVFTVEILILLMIEYKRLTETDKQFTLQMSSHYLKFLQELKFIQSIGQDKNVLKGQFQNIETNDLSESIAVNGKKINFSYNYGYCSDLSSKQLIDVICDYLDILVGQGNSQYVNFALICKMYVVNIEPNDKNTKLYSKLKSAINYLGKTWDNSFYAQLLKCKTYDDFIDERKVLLKKHQKYHKINVTCTGDINQAIIESQRDYQIQTKILNGRKKALNKIMNWWRINKTSQKNKLQKGIVNYFDLLLKNQNPNITRISTQYQSLNDFRMFEKLYDCNLTLNVPLILTIEKTREDLLKFYLKHIVSSSLDFHFILITLRKLQTLKQQYTGLCKQLQSGIVERDISGEIQIIDQAVNDLQSNINTWKNDEKWLRQKNLSFKKKKVFEVKWMTKSLNQMKIIRKRAGLKKQQKLQLKKRLLKG